MSSAPRRDPPGWVQIEHDGMTCQLRHPWWVRWLVLWTVPVVLGLGGAIWLAYPALVAAVPAVGLQVAVLFSGVSIVAVGISAAITLVVHWWTAPVDLRLRGDHFLVTRRFLGRTRSQRFDLRHTTVYAAEDRSFVRLVMDRPGAVTEEVVAVPVPQRTAWLGRVLRGATIAATHRRRGAGGGPSVADQAAMSALLAARSSWS